MKSFKNVTSGKIVVSGMTTFNSLRELNFGVKISIYMDLDLPKEQSCSLLYVTSRAVKILVHVT